MRVTRDEPQPREDFFTFRGVTYRSVFWGESHCCVAGDGRGIGRAPLVLLHGFAQSASSWDEVAPLLARTRPVVALELVGHGGSDRPRDDRFYRIDEAAIATCAFLEHVARQAGVSAVPVVGYSMGGRIALAAAQHRGQLFAALILESAGLGPTDSEERAQAAVRDADCAARLRSEGLKVFMDRWENLPLFATQRTLPVAVQERIRRGRLSNDAEALARVFEGAGQHTMPLREEALARLSRFAFPTLYLVGSSDQKYRNLAQDLKKRGACSVCIVENAGHNVHLEVPEKYGDVINNFLARF
ncbi:MAG: 2-succinyl-6-hydroxy-2,4-cyclohexadiene-1-carboxylate synthase [Gordonibacter sp.]|nr:2-succinyl-6-hydroxy-2,4-cyclohexadiene-1-carboxylate synthase [Gordonibacter sp.]